MIEIERCKHGLPLSRSGTTAGREQEGLTWQVCYPPCPHCLKEEGICPDCFGVGEWAEEWGRDEYGDVVIIDRECDTCGGTGRCQK